jgi:hypothetical protein
MLLRQIKSLKAEGPVGIYTATERATVKVPNRPLDCERITASTALETRGTADFEASGKVRLLHAADDGILDVLAALRRIAERNSAEVERVVRGYYKLTAAGSARGDRVMRVGLYRREHLIKTIPRYLQSWAS